MQEFKRIVFKMINFFQESDEKLIYACCIDVHAKPSVTFPKTIRKIIENMHFQETSLTIHASKSKSLIQCSMFTWLSNKPTGMFDLTAAVWDYKYQRAKNSTLLTHWNLHVTDPYQHRSYLTEHQFGWRQSLVIINQLSCSQPSGMPVIMKNHILIE